jgi:hypothetical protein
MNIKASQQCEAFLSLASGRYPVFLAQLLASWLISD